MERQIGKDPIYYCFFWGDFEGLWLPLRVELKEKFKVESHNFDLVEPHNRILEYLVAERKVGTSIFRIKHGGHATPENPYGRAFPDKHYLRFSYWQGRMMRDDHESLPMTEVMQYAYGKMYYKIEFLTNLAAEKISPDFLSS